jgi:hypothetical protein
MRGANVGVVISSVHEYSSVKMQGWIPAKLYENIGLGSSTLLIAPPGTDVEHVAQTVGFARRFGGSDIEGIAIFIDQLMSGLKLEQRNLGIFDWNSIGALLDRHLRRQLATTTSQRAGAL